MSLSPLYTATPHQNKNTIEAKMNDQITPFKNEGILNNIIPIPLCSFYTTQCLFLFVLGYLGKKYQANKNAKANISTALIMLPLKENPQKKFDHSFIL